MISERCTYYYILFYVNTPPQYGEKQKTKRNLGDPIQEAWIPVRDHLTWGRSVNPFTGFLSSHFPATTSNISCFFFSIAVKNTVLNSFTSVPEVDIISFDQAITYNYYSPINTSISSPDTNHLFTLGFTFGTEFKG